MIIFINMYTGLVMAHTQGGRGHKAPYQTKNARVPVPMATQVSEIVNKYHEFVANGGDAENPPYFVSENKPVHSFSKIVELDVAVDLAKEILKNKKSSKLSLQKLLKAIYGKDVTL